MSKFSRGSQEYTLMVLAAGRGMRLTKGVSSKAMFRVGDRPLISFILACRQLPEIVETIVLSRPEDIDLQKYLAEINSPQSEISILKQITSSTGKGTSALYRAAKSSHHIWATCDEICSIDDIARLIDHYETADNDVVSILPVTPIIGLDDPVWVEVQADMSVQAIGKDLQPTGLTWGNIRISGEKYQRLHTECSKQESHETKIYDSIIRQFTGRHIAVHCPHLFDVDTKQEAIRAANLEI